ncbi:HNH endonuclease [Reyranella sp.]|uniref:HNH endonuclease n=1 Tax=Reyranella sp. TaxID=1929291 RepID=UPI003525858F
MPTREQAEARRKAIIDQHRPSPARRGYDAAWRRCSKAYLLVHPICTRCPDPATEVDHKVSPRERPDLRLSWSNLRGLCKSCHSRRTALDQGFARSGRSQARR